MLIRSQDKKTILVLENAKRISIGTYQKKGKDYVYDGGYGKINPNCFTVEYDGLFIAEYSTEAKAIKVLDMICDAYELCERTDYQNIGYVGNTVFQMPSDEEVEEEHE
ncbi:MAG TPA: hypothetical protein VN258_06555 [Mobilitalea sp.]|nr:hypothetical protein [Mobilitalea sp.]